MSAWTAGGARAQLATLALAAAGAFIAWLAHVPLALLIGPTAAVAFARRRWPQLAVDLRLRTAAIIVAGTLIGGSVKAGLLSDWRQWLVSLAAILIFVPLAAWIGRLYLRRFGGQDALTAMLCAQPGGILVMLALSQQVGGNTERVMFAHALRVACGPLMMALLLALGGYHVPPGLPASSAAAAHMAPLQLGLLALLGVGGWGLGKLIKLPAAELLGPMTAGIVGVQLGWVSGTVPLLPLGLSLGLIGAAVGATLPTQGGRALLHDAFHTLMTLGLFMALAFVMALGLAQITDVLPVEFFLAAAPAGLTEMPTVAMLIGVNAAYVALFATLRFMLCALLATWQVKQMKRTEAG